ncbi:hypothetical protein PTNB73_08512 [Pyrenophora teres f. teres]|nr:hypothetical protein HRS9139_08623 [Pyrenophora teres f. teres]KAE8859032.1 hypothetical protein PTNB73_08512 [Pyrenophora teres f. teres]KAE8860896.1 hypothetical protein PTNB29_05991 [Pyrenophora teres f. teres]
MPFLYETKPYNPSSPTTTGTTPNPNIITFLLTGRTTLSEHSPSEKISVDYEIAHRSPYLRNFLPSQAPSSSSCMPRHLPPITLPSIDPAALIIYISYLATSRITPMLPFPHSLSLHACVDLLYAHMLGAVIRAQHFQDAVIDCLAEVLDTVQAPDVRVLEMLYLEEGVSEVLRGDLTEGKRTVEIDDGGGEGDEKMWYIDDDEKMSSMAAHYLGKKSMGSEGVPIQPKTQGSSSTVDCKTKTTSLYYTADLHLTKPLPLLPSAPRAQHEILNTRGVGLDPFEHFPHKLSPTVREIEAHEVPPRTRNTVRDGTISIYPHDYDVDSPDDTSCKSTLPPPLVSPASGPSPKLHASLLRKEQNEYQDHGHQAVHEENTEPAPEERHYSALCLDHESTIPLTRNFPFTPVSKPTPYPTLPTSTPLSPSPTVTLYPYPFASSFQPILPSTPAPEPTSPTLPRPYHIATPASLHFPPLINRKPAPSRGQDWVDQWDKLFLMRGTQGFGQRRSYEERKRSRGRWFVDMVEDLTAKI